MHNMDTTHTPANSAPNRTDALQELADIDAAEAPDVAERLAAELTERLEDSSPVSQAGEQLAANFDLTETPTGP